MCHFAFSVNRLRVGVGGGILQKSHRPPLVANVLGGTGSTHPESDQ